MSILALDLGTQTGWAYTEEGLLESGTEDFSPKRGDSKGMRYILFNRWLVDIASDSQGEAIDLIAYERAHHRGGAATEVAHGFSTRVQEFCAARGIEHMAVHTATIKKFATGSGRANKQDMLHAAINRWPGQFEDRIIQMFSDNLLPDAHSAYDQADALHLMAYVRSIT